MIYCAAGTNLKSFIKAFTGKDQKFFFPYELLDSYDKLDMLVSNLKYENFYSNLTKENITKDDFELVLKVSKENNLINLRDLLEYYNKMDVIPFLEACKNYQKTFYQPEFELEM